MAWGYELKAQVLMVTLMVPSWNQIQVWLIELSGLANDSALRAQQAVGAA